MKKNIYSILLDMVAEAKKCDNLVQTMNLVNLTVGDLLDNKIIVDEPNSTEQKEKALIKYLSQKVKYIKFSFVYH